MRIGVTGGCGYLGSVLVPELLALGHKVDALDMRPPETALLQKIDPKKFRYHSVDLSLAPVVAELAGEFDLIVHLAALVGYPACEKSPSAALKSNVGTTRNIIKLKNKTTPVIYSSTISNYGPQNSTVTEETPTQPNSVYGKTKKEAEELIMSEPQNIVFRFAGAFGVSPQMRHDNLIHDFVHQATSGNALSVYESHFIRQFVHVKDMVGSILFALENWERMQGNIFNVGNPATEVTKRQLVERIAKHFPFEYRFENTGTDLEKRDYPVSFEKISKLGFKPKMDLDAGLQELIGYYRSAAAQMEKELGYGG